MLHRRWLFLSLGRSGWGEAVCGRRIARSLRARGDQVQYLCHPRLSGLFGSEATSIPTLHGPPFEGWLLDQVRALAPDAIVLADLLLGVTALVRRDAPGALAVDVPVIGVDSWDLASLDGQLDTLTEGVVTLADSVVHHPWRMVPVPLASPSVDNGFCVLPRRIDVPPSRRDLGLPDRPLVLVTTGPWQHHPYGGEVAALQSRMPSVLDGALRGLDVVHVGPIAFDLPRARVHYRRRLRAPAFEALVASVDLFLSLNAAATTHMTAAVHGVPSLTLVDPDRFQAWPIGWNRALGRLLHDNPWAGVVRRTDWLAPDLDQAVRGLLAGPERRKALERNAGVLEGLRRLPTAAAVLDTVLSRALR